jgi:hypothetical protein
MLPEMGPPDTTISSILGAMIAGHRRSRRSSSIFENAVYRYPELPKVRPLSEWSKELYKKNGHR